MATTGKKALEPHALAIKGPAEDIAAWHYCITPPSASINQEVFRAESQALPPLPAFSPIKYQKNQCYQNR